MTILNRIRANAGQLSLLAALTLVASVLLTGAPKFANKLTDDALRTRITGLPWQVKDLTFLLEGDTRISFGPQHAQSRLEQQRNAISPAVGSRIQHSWFAVSTPLERTFGVDTGRPKMPNYGLRAGNGLREAVRMVQGRWPDNSPSRLPRVEIVVSEISAKILDLKVGTDFAITTRLDKTPVPVRIVGIFAPLDEKAAIWDPAPFAMRAYVPQSDEELYQAVFLTDVPGVQAASQNGVVVGYEWRYQIAPSALDMAILPQLIAGVHDARRQGIDSTNLQTGLDTALARFADTARSAQAMFAIVQAGTLATLAGLVVLSARLAANRRRQEFALLRARGAALRRIFGRVVLETLVAVPIAALAGYLLGGQSPGRPAGTGILLIAFAAIALLALPLLAVRASNRFTEERTDRIQVSLKRRTAEFALVGLAALGVWLLRRRGLEFDLFLVAVPVLLATAAAIVTLRLIPAPLALAGRLAARRRGSVAFLGLTRAGRSASAIVGPVAVLIVAVCTGVFSIGVAGTVNEARDRATDFDLAGDVYVQGMAFSGDTRDALLAVPGVSGVSQRAELVSRDILASREVGARRLAQTFVLVVDGPTWADVIARSGRAVDVPVEVMNAGRQREVPAIVSPQLAKELEGNRGKGVVDLQGRQYDFAQAGVAEAFPSIPRTATRFLVMPWQALPIQPDKPLVATAFLISGTPDIAAVTKVADEGQTKWVSRAGGTRLGFQPESRVKGWEQRRSELESLGVNSVLSFAFGVGALGGIVLALLAVGFAVLAEARTRGKALSRLRTMGLAQRQGRWLLLVELAPVMGAAVSAGAAVGVFLPALVGPALNLTSFTDGYDVGLRFDPVVIGGALGLVLAGLGTALLVESLFNRRMRLGEVLRVGSE